VCKRLRNGKLCCSVRSVICLRPPGALRVSWVLLLTSAMYRRWSLRENLVIECVHSGARSLSWLARARARAAPFELYSRHTLIELARYFPQVYEPTVFGAPLLSPLQSTLPRRGAKADHLGQRTMSTMCTSTTHISSSHYGTRRVRRNSIGYGR
jgi:hypothetical protein